jgi:hypothetical protein
VHLPEHVRAPRERARSCPARRAVARAGMRPARSAASAIVRSFAALAEVVARRLLDAVAAVTEVDVVQVELEDLVLRELLLEPAREERLADLARQVRSGSLRSRFFTTCCVIVEPPCRVPPARRLTSERAERCPSS